MRAPRALKRNYVPGWYVVGLQPQELFGMLLGFSPKSAEAQLRTWLVCCWDASPKSAEAQLRTWLVCCWDASPKSAEAQLRTWLVCCWDASPKSAEAQLHTFNYLP